MQKRKKEQKLVKLLQYLNTLQLYILLIKCDDTIWINYRNQHRAANGIAE